MKRDGDKGRDKVTVRTSPSSLAHEDGCLRHPSIEKVFPSACNSRAGFGFLENVMFGLDDCRFVLSFIPDTYDKASDYEVSIST